MGFEEPHIDFGFSCETGVSPNLPYSCIYAHQSGLVV